MSTKVSGRVYKVFEKEFPPNKGKKAVTWYSIKLEDDKIYYRCKANNPGDIAGKLVEFTTGGDDGVQAEVTAGSLTVVEAKVGANTIGSGSVGGSGSTRDASIQYQSSRKDAIALVDVLLRAAAIKLPAKEAMKLEAVEALVDGYTASFFNDIGTLGAVARATGSDTAQEEPQDVTDEE